MSNLVKKTRWRLWIYLSLGSFGFIGFWYVSRKMGDKKALKLGFVFLIVNIVSGGTNLVFIQIACFAAQIYFAIEVNSRYLDFLSKIPEAGSEVSMKSVHKTVGNSIDYLQKNEYFVDIENNSSDEEMDLDSKSAPTLSPNLVTPDRKDERMKDSSNSSDDVIDINNISLENLVSSIEVDARTLARIISIRDQIGAFSSYEHLFKRADIRPHEMIKFRGKLTFGLIKVSEKGNQEPRETGINRIVDL
jgi:DNA uptake protein ComE-like DNA-binding protein